MQKRNKFGLSHYKMCGGYFGLLYPITWYNVNPLDTIQQSTSVLVRLAPMLAPIMHAIKVRVHL